MNEQVYEDVTLERKVASSFGVDATIGSVILSHFPVSRNAYASLFLTDKKQLLLYIEGEEKLLLSDIKKLVSRIGLVPEIYYPPKGRPNYFDEIGRAKFVEVFPGRRAIVDADIIFYKTLSPYLPALVLIKEVKAGVINQFDSNARGGWRPAARFSYRRIATS